MRADKVAQSAVINVRLPHPLTAECLTLLRQRLPAECGLTDEDFYIDGPLVPEPHEWAMPVQDGVSRWYRANLYRAFYSPDYQRGDPPLLVRVAEWLEVNMPGGEVWYGHDGSDDLRPFGPAARAELLAFWGGESDRA